MCPFTISYKSSVKPSTNMAKAVNHLGVVGVGWGWGGVGVVVVGWDGVGWNSSCKPYTMRLTTNVKIRRRLEHNIHCLPQLCTKYEKYVRSSCVFVTKHAHNLTNLKQNLLLMNNIQLDFASNNLRFI